MKDPDEISQNIETNTSDILTSEKKRSILNHLFI